MRRMSDNAEWGPLAALIGEWEGDQGLDFAYANAEGKVKDTPYREKTSMKPFGPVENGKQVLFGLDYRMAAWRGTEENPFHTEVGYWLWDAADAQVFRCFVVPRGSLVLAGGDATPDAKDFTMHAECGSEIYGVLSNRFLATAARTSNYKCTVTVNDDGTWAYDELTTVEHARFGAVVEHTDRNLLHRVD
jgi:hypothetical protein